MVEKLSSSPRYSERVCGKYKGWTRLVSHCNNFILWPFAGVDIGIINIRKGPQNRKSRGKNLWFSCSPPYRLLYLALSSSAHLLNLPVGIRWWEGANSPACLEGGVAFQQHSRSLGTSNGLVLVARFSLCNSSMCCSLWVCIFTPPCPHWLNYSCSKSQQELLSSPEQRIPQADSMTAHEEYLMFYISMLHLTLKKNFKIVRLVAKCKLTFIEWFVRLRFKTPKFILVFSIHPEISVSNTTWSNNKIDGLLPVL